MSLCFFSLCPRDAVGSGSLSVNDCGAKVMLFSFRPLTYDMISNDILCSLHKFWLVGFSPRMKSCRVVITEVVLSDERVLLTQDSVLVQPYIRKNPVGYFTVMPAV